MARATLDMNAEGLGARGGGHVGHGPLPFSVESLLEAERVRGSEPGQLGEERPPGSSKPGAWPPPVTHTCPPRKCSVSGSQALKSDRGVQPRFERSPCASLYFQVPPALHPALSANTKTTASHGRPSPPLSCWRLSASFTRSSTCPLLSAPSSPAA
ncbi:homeobox protein VENTX isoform X1 [Cricetulus griseus]|uniref:Homeobox protein VENTX isoform X1 n=1 Tax=Cricetulus griseus TaxID=10029 RepID=A0A9J7JKI9_CRIGR|nr:homeobox protein VENTX isoform X1 [Cricetulus griseus]XP_027265024.1 homeobox protein VENTX isoform X1 [Cricetulus griseus]